MSLEHPVCFVLIIDLTARYLLMLFFLLSIKELRLSLIRDT